MHRPDEMNESDDASQDQADRAWFRAAVEPHLDQKPVTPGWAAIADLVETGNQPVTSPREVAGRRPLRAALAIAAALAIVVAVAALVQRVTADDEAADSLQTGEPAATGWYVPVGLSQGWVLLGVNAVDGGPVCERGGTQWTDPAGERSVGLFYDACATAPTEDDERDIRPKDENGQPVTYQDEEGNLLPIDGPRTELEAVDLGEGLTGVSMVLHPREGAPEPMDSLAWDRDGGWSLRALGLSENELITVARQVVADPARDDLDVGGLEALQMVERWDAPATDHSAHLQVFVETPGGQRINLMMDQPGSGGRTAGQDVLVPETIDGQPNLTFRYENPNWAAVRFGGPWPGADVSFMRMTTSPEDTNQAVSDDQLRTFIASLRPATTSEWRGYLDSATGPVSDVARSAPDLASMFDPANPTADPVPVEPLDIPAPFEGGNSVASEAGTTIDDGTENRDHLSNLDGLDVRLELPALPLPAGGRLEASLQLVNPTDQPITINECTHRLTRWGLVRDDPQPQGLPPRLIIDCFADEIINVPAGGAARMVLEGPPVEGMVARAPARTGRHPYGGALEPGDYLAVVEVPGVNGTIRVEYPIAVTEPPCPAITETVATRYLDQTEADAGALAEADGRPFRVSEIDGEPQVLTRDLRCERINATIVNGQVVWVDLG